MGKHSVQELRIGSGHARYIGRVGALAVALGIGTAVATGYGVAAADTTSSNGPSNDTGNAQSSKPAEPHSAVSSGPSPNTDTNESRTSTVSAQSTPSTEEDEDPSTSADDGVGSLETADNDPSDPEMHFSGSVVDTSTNDTSQPTDETPPTPESEVTPEVVGPIAAEPDDPVAPQNPGTQNNSAPLERSATAHSPTNTSTSSSATKAAFGSSVTADIGSTAQARLTLDTDTSTPTGAQQRFTTARQISAFTTAQPQTVATPEPAQGLVALPGVILNAAATVVSALLSPFLSPRPSAPAQPPLLFALLGWVQREFQRTFFNRSPVANTNAYTTSEDAGLSGNVLTDGIADTDADGDALTAALVTGPAHGNLVLNPNGAFTYTPKADYNGADSFTYKISDESAGFHLHGLSGISGPDRGHTDTATVTVNVTAVNDPPVARNDSATTAEDNPVTVNVLINDSDVEGNTLTPQLVSQPGNGTLTATATGWTYTPKTNFSGTDTFTYRVNDGNANSATAAVSITVTPVNDPPVANNDTATTAEEVPVTVNVLTNDSDVEGNTLTPQLVSQPGSGTLVATATGWTYTPKTDFSGTDTFSYRVNDGASNSNTATVTVTVTPNTAPVAAPDSYTVRANTPLTIAAPGFLGNDTDADGDTLRLGTFNPAPGGEPHGTLTPNADGSFTYTPGAGFTGTDTWRYRAEDSADVSEFTTITFNVVSTAPVITSLAPTAIRRVDAAFEYTMTVTDIDTPLDDLVVTITDLGGDNIGTMSQPVSTSPGTYTFVHTATFQEIIDAQQTPTVELSHYRITVSDGTEEVFEDIAVAIHPRENIVQTSLPFPPTIATPADVADYVDFELGTNGTTALATRTGDGSADNPYKTTLTVVSPAGTTTDETIVGNPGGAGEFYGDLVVGADGTAAILAYTGSGSDPSATQTQLVVIRPTGTTTHTINGLAADRLVVGANGAVAVTTYTGDGSAAQPHQTTLTVVGPNGTPASRTAAGLPPIDLAVGPFARKGPVIGANGTAAQVTLTDDGSESTLTVVGPNGTTARTITGYPAGDVAVGADGTVAAAAYTEDGKTTLVVISPTLAITVTDPPIAGGPTLDNRSLPKGPVVGENGTAVLATFTGSTANPYATTLTIVGPTGTTTTHTITGYPVGDVAVSANGTVAAITHTANGSAANPDQTNLLVVSPTGTRITPITPTITGYPVNVAVAADGTIAVVTEVGDHGGAGPDETTLTVISPTGTTATSTIDGIAISTAIGADGTAAVAAFTGTDFSNNQTIVTAISRTGTVTTTEAFNGLPAGDMVVGDNGTTAVTIYYPGTASAARETNLVAISPSGVVTPAPIDPQRVLFGDVVVTADGIAAQGSYQPDNFWSYRNRTVVTAISPTGNTVNWFYDVGVPVGGVAIGDDGFAYLVARRGRGDADDPYFFSVTRFDLGLAVLLV